MTDPKSSAAPRQPEGPQDLIDEELDVLAEVIDYQVIGNCTHQLILRLLAEVKRRRAQPADAAPLVALRRATRHGFELAVEGSVIDDDGMRTKVSFHNARLDMEVELAALAAAPTTEAAPLDALRRALDEVCESLCGGRALDHDAACNALHAALAAAPRDERPDALALRDEQWRLAVSGERMSRSEPHLKTADWEALRGPLDKLMAGTAAAPIGAPDARPHAVREAVLAERKKWVDALNGACDRCLRSAANTLTDDDAEEGEFLDCARCGTALRDLVTGVEPLPEKQSPPAAASLEVEALDALADCVNGSKLLSTSLERARAVLRRSGRHA